MSISVSHEENGECGYWTTVIVPVRPWFHIDFRLIWQYRDLIRLFVRRDFVASYKQTILGPLWFFITPLFGATVMTIVFSSIAKIPTDGIPPFLFYMAGSVCWGYFVQCLTGTSNVFLEYSGVFGKVYFPRLVVPISIVISGLLKFAIQLTIFLGCLVFFIMRGAGVSVNWAGVLVLPLLVFQMAILGLGCGILISSLTTKYRDLTVLVGFGLGLWMYATPIIYPLSEVPMYYRPFVAINPMVSVVEGFRQIFLGTSSLEFGHILTTIIVTAVVFGAGLLLFNRIETTFMDTV
ncbi:MAG: ABC transporter permease [Deltaproteobacteria bacterium]|nr:ABC transporter permease [Deltaproteobacteria bacterium]